MTSKTCFVIMPIGDQEFGSNRVTKAELKQRYDDLIKEAIQKADPSLEIVRADEVSFPGSITSDIITRIMHSDIVVADVTYPNPNVFYELGLRHACRVGTVIIRDVNGPNIPFDIMHLRHIDYESTPSGLKALAEELEKHFEYLEKNIEHTDNQFLELAKISGYRFPQYGKSEVSEEDAKLELFTAAIQSPEFLSMILRKSQGEIVDDAQMNSELIKLLATQPNLLQSLLWLWQKELLARLRHPSLLKEREIHLKVSDNVRRDEFSNQPVSNADAVSSALLGLISLFPFISRLQARSGPP